MLTAPWVSRVSIYKFIHPELLVGCFTIVIYITGVVLRSRDLETVPFHYSGPCVVRKLETLGLISTGTDPDPLALGLRAQDCHASSIDLMTKVGGRFNRVRLLPTITGADWNSCVRAPKGDPRHRIGSDIPGYTLTSARVATRGIPQQGFTMTVGREALNADQFVFRDLDHSTYLPLKRI